MDCRDRLHKPVQNIYVNLAMSCFRNFAGDCRLKFIEYCIAFFLLAESSSRDEPTGHDRGPVARGRELNTRGDPSVACARGLQPLFGVQPLCAQAERS